MKKQIKEHSLPSLKEAAKRSKEATKIIHEEITYSSRLLEFAKNRKYFIRTYGCQANVLDSEAIEGILQELGFVPVDDPLKSDLLILNTCAVRENAEDKVFGEIGSLKRLKDINPGAIIALCGCMVQQTHIVEQVKKSYPQVDLVFGTHNIFRLPQLLDEVVFDEKRVIEVLSKEGEVIEGIPLARSDRFKAFVNIMYGCDKFCTYCIVPYTRGKQRSRRVADILNECQNLVDNGYQEITLLGQNVNAYGKDLDSNLNFAKLLELVAKTGIARLRFTTSHPWDFSKEMFEVIAKYKNIMPCIHLPLQSGSDDVLRRMGRRYTAFQYRQLVDELKSLIKDVALTTDIIVGFPNESEADFEETLKMVQYCHFDSAFTFIYSPRVGTPAAKMEDNVSMEEKKRRFDRLVKVVEQEAEERAKRYINNVYDVLVEGTSKKRDDILSGYTETMKLVNFKGSKDLIGKIVKVKILESHTFSLIGELVSDE